MNAENTTPSDPTPPTNNEQNNSGTDSVMPAIYDMPILKDLPVDIAKAACSKEKKITHQLDILIAPRDITGDQDVVETMRLARRVVLCTSCGNLRLIS